MSGVRLDAVAVAASPEPVSPSGDGLARSLVALTWVPLVLGAGGALRYLTGCALEPAWAVCALVAMPVAVWALRGVSQARTAIGGWLGVGLPIAGAVLIALNRAPFGGLVTVGGGDAGNHVLQQRAFVTSEPGVYMGFVGLYAVHDALQRALAWDAFDAFRATFLGVAALLALIPSFWWVQACAASRWSRERWAYLSLGVFLPWALAVQLLLVAPLLHYNQADGFFPHVASAAIPALTWAVYSSATGVVPRLGALAVGALAYRFTYGLNLGDFLLASAVASAWEARSVAGRDRGLSLTVAAGFVVASVMAYIKVREVFFVSEGAVVPPLLTWLGPAMGGVIGVVLATRRHLSPDGMRFTVFPTAFVAGTALPLLGLAWSGHGFYYYAWKYVLHAQVLCLLALTIVVPLGVLGALREQRASLTERVQRLRDLWRSDAFAPAFRGFVLAQCAFVVPLAVASAVLASRWADGVPLRVLELGLLGLGLPVGVWVFLLHDRVRMRGVAWVLVVGLSFWGIRESERPYRKSFSDRLRASAPWRDIGPLSDRAADRIIDETLAASGHRFGAMLTFPWPTSNFTNALHGGRAGWELFFEGDVPARDGECVFWNARTDKVAHLVALNAEHGHPVRRILDRLQSDARRSCRDYTPTWGEAPSERICWVCYGEGGA